MAEMNCRKTADSEKWLNAATPCLEGRGAINPRHGAAVPLELGHSTS